MKKACDFCGKMKECPNIETIALFFCNKKCGDEFFVKKKVEDEIKKLCK